MKTDLSMNAIKVLDVCRRRCGSNHGAVVVAEVAAELGIYREAVEKHMRTLKSAKVGYFWEARKLKDWERVPGIRRLSGVE